MISFISFFIPMFQSHTAPAAEEQQHFLVTLPFRSEQIDDADSNFDVSVWRCTYNCCEMQGFSTCETASGLYYGSAEDEMTKFCPRHYFEMHEGPNAPYQLIDLAKPHNGKDVVNPEFVAVLPWVTKVSGEAKDPNAKTFDQALWRSSKRICACADQSWCDGTGFFYGASDSSVPKFCARHFFGEARYTLIDMTVGEFEMALRRAEMRDATAK